MSKGSHRNLQVSQSSHDFVLRVAKTFGFRVGNAYDFVILKAKKYWSKIEEMEKIEEVFGVRVLE